MRRLLVFLALLLALPLAAAAEDATPPATPASVNPADPALGNPVEVVDAAGAPYATVTVEAMERDWEGHHDDAGPTEGYGYVAFTVSVEGAAEEAPVSVIDVDFALQDGAGFLWGASAVEADPGADVTPLGEEVSLGAGEKVTFLLVFEIRPGEPLGHLYWQPDTGRLVTIAALSGE